MDHSTRFPASSAHHPSLINSASSIGSSANNLSLGSINLSTTATPLASPPALLPMPTIGERSYSDSYATSGRNSAFSSTSHTSANSTTTISNSSSNFQRQMLQMPNTSWTSTLTAGNQQYPQESTRSINTLLEQSRSGFSGEESLEPLPLNFPNQMLLETQHPTDQRQPNTAEDAASREETTFEDAMEALYHRMNRGNL